MRKEVKIFDEALQVLKAMSIDWVTTNKIRNSLWDTGVAFFGRNHCRVTYYDEMHNLLLTN